jgi:hypothetical protein
MHGGFIVSHCGWLDLRRVLEDHCEPLSEDGTVSQADWSRLPRGEAVVHKVSITAPFDRGPRLVTEGSAPFDHPDGIGILAPVHAGGDDMGMLLDGPADGGMRFRYAGDRFPEGGQLEQKIIEHTRTHLRPDADDWNLTVVRRGNGTYDIRPRTTSLREGTVISINVAPMNPADAEELPKAFAALGWPGRACRTASWSASGADWGPASRIA